MSSSLRARRQSRASSSVPSTKKKKRYDKEEKESQSLSIGGLAFVFFAVCLIGGLREYSRVQQGKPSVVSRFEQSKMGQKILHSNYKTNHPPQEQLTPEEDEALEWEGSTRYHVIFSTDCSSYQHWQSYLVYYSAMMVRQPGLVTRIVSGCTDEEAADIKNWHETHVRIMSSRFHMHLTPHFSGVKDKDGNILGDYKFFNKPFGLKHWMEHFDYLELERDVDDVVILIDPDMVLLKPITADFSDESSVVIGERRKGHELGTRVTHGVPFAQSYGLGTHWQTFDLDKIVGPDSPAKKVNHKEAFLYYPAGPPYLATVKDMYQIAIKWSEFAPEVHSQYPHLLAEMYAYCIAAAHLDLKHQLLDSLMISNTDAGGEGWPLIDQIPASEICQVAKQSIIPDYPVPSVLHMCQRYCVGEDWFFGKRKIPHDLYGCEQPLFEEPPPNLGILHNFRRPPNQKDPSPLSPIRAPREAFMVCHLTALVNEASTFSKSHACAPGTANLKKCLKVADLFTNRKKKK